MPLCYKTLPIFFTREMEDSFDSALASPIDGLYCLLHHFTTSQPVYPKMCSIDIFVNLQLVGQNFKGGLFDPRFEELGVGVGVGYGPIR